MSATEILSISSYRISPFGVLASVSLIAIIGCGAFSYRRQSDSSVGRTFLLLASVAALWIFGYAMDLFTGKPSVALFWTRWSFAALSFLPPTIYLFTTTFLGTARRSRSLIVLGYVLAYVFMLVILWSGWVLRGVIAYDWGFGFDPGPFRSVFISYFLLYAAGSLLQLLDGLQRERSASMKKQIRILLLAFFVAFVGVTDFFISEGLIVYPWGYLSTLGFVAIISYAMVRYPFLLFIPSAAYDTIVHTMSDGLVMVGPQAKITAVNPALCDLLHYREEDLIGKPVEQLFDTGAHPLRPDLLENERTPGGAIRTVDAMLLSSAGDTVPVNLSRSIVRHPSGRLVGVVGVARDMREARRMQRRMEELNESLKRKILEVEEKTAKLESSYRDLQTSRDTIVDMMQDRERSNRELVEANRRLEELDRMKDHFLASVSHEFRSPLTSIRSFAEILLNYPDEGQTTRREFLSIIQAETDRLARLVDNCLDLSRIKAGKMNWRNAWIDLRPLAEDVLRVFRQQISAKGIQTRVAQKEPLPPVWIDRDRLTQVLHNLVGNAVMFTDAGGTVSIELDRFAGKRKEDPEEFVRIVVADTGKGIPNAALPTIFDRFRQVGDVLTDKPSGTGLGLTICREIVEHYGGRIWAESREGEGSRFYVLLSVRPTLKEGSGPDGSASPEGTPPARD